MKIVMESVKSLFLCAKTTNTCIKIAVYWKQCKNPETDFNFVLVLDDLFLIK